MTSENLILNGLHFSFEIFIWISFFLQCSMFVVAFLPKIKIGAKFKIISRNHSSTISCKNCNWQLQSDFAIYSCSYSSYQLKKIATKSCLQLKIAIHNFLQLLVELRLLSGCKNLQCALKSALVTFSLKSKYKVISWLLCLKGNAGWYRVKLSSHTYLPFVSCAYCQDRQ